MMCSLYQPGRGLALLLDGLGSAAAPLDMKGSSVSDVPWDTEKWTLLRVPLAHAHLALMLTQVRAQSTANLYFFKKKRLLC